MTGFKETPITDYQVRPFNLIGNEWMLVAAAREGRANAMTAAWGGLGTMWRRPAAFIVIRPQRFTKEFVDASPFFSLNFFGPGRRDLLNYFGAVSGRDEDKIAKTGLGVEYHDGAPCFSEAETVIVCKKLYAQPYEARFFIDPQPDRDLYPQKDYHTFYVGEVVRILAKDRSATAAGPEAPGKDGK